jgi:cysteine synthase
MASQAKRNEVLYQAGRLAYLKKSMKDEPGTFWTRQYDNPANGLSYARLAELFVRSMGQVDWLVEEVPGLSRRTVCQMLR